MKNTRTHNAFLVMLSVGIRQFLNLILQFVSRIIFIRILGAEYLGLNGLFSNVLSLLSLSELGIGSAISFYLYQPLADNDTERIKSLMQFYKNCYRAVGFTMIGIGVCIMILLWKYFGGEEADCVLAVLLKDRSGISSYTLLICMAGIWQYVRCGDKLRTIFYMGVLITGFLVLLVNQSRLGIWIMVIVFIAVVVVQRPTAELIKRDMTLFSIYLFMLCNMSLLTNYTDLLYADITYDLEQSICLDLLAATGGIIFFNYWSRIPAGMDLKRLVMRKMHRGYCFLLRLICVIFIGVILGGNFWSGLPNSLGMKAVKDFAIPLVDEVYQGKSVFYLCFEQFGVIGSLLILIICVCIISELKKNYSLDKPVTGMLILIAAVFLIQLLFWEGSISALPAYWIYTVLAVSYKEKGEKISSKKMKFEGEE